MAEERVPDIIIPIKYEYKDEGLKKAAGDVDRLTKKIGKTTTYKGKVTATPYDNTIKALDSLQAKFKKVGKTLTLDNDKIVAQYNKAVKAMRDAYDARGSLAQAATNYKNYDGKSESKKQSLYNSIVNKSTEFERKTRKAAVELRNLYTYEDRYRADQSAKAAKAAEKEAEQVSKAQVQAEKEAAKAAQEAAQEQEDAKRRVKEAWQSLGDTFKKLPQAFSKGIKTFAATLYVLRRITNSIKQAFKQISNLIDASSSWVENLNLLEVVFGDVSEGAQETKKWVSDLARTFSMDKNAIVQNVAMFKQMANAMGQAADVGERMSEVLVQLGLDISSLRNVKTETAMNDLASAIAGQIKPVRKYGFDVSLQSINAMLKETGVGGSVTNLSQSDKQLARTILLLRQSTDAWGDLGKTINTFANQQRVMNDQFETTKRLLGQVFIGTFQFGDSFDKASETAGIATKIIWRVNSVLIAFNEILEAILPNVDSVNGGIATMAEDAQDDIDDMNESLENSLASFDKFNVMTSGSSSAAGNNASLESVFNKEALKYLEDFQKRSQQITSYARELADDLLKKFFPEFEEWSKKNEGTFSDWVKSSEDIKVGLLDWIKPITDFTNIIEDAVANALENIPAILKASSNLLNGILQFLKPILEIIVAIVNQLGSDGVAGLLKAIFFVLISIKGLQIIVGTVKGLTTIIESMQVLIPLIKNVGVQIKQAFAGGSGTTITGFLVGVTALVAGITTFVALRDKMTSTARAITIALAGILAVITGIVVTLVAMKSMHLTPVVAIGRGIAAGAAIAGTVLALGATFGSIANKHAEGGYQTGGLFYAGENGAEWVGRQGNTSTIINDKQMSDIMQQSVAMGVVQGNRMSNAGRTAGGDGKVAVVNLDGKRLFEVVQQNGKKVGKVFAEA